MPSPLRCTLIPTVLMMTLVPSASAQVDGSRWYVQAGAGAGSSGTPRHVGWNLDTLCYPVQSECIKHEGYRWFYDLPSDVGPSFSVALGRRWNRLRFELGMTYVKSNLADRFLAINFLDGTPVPPPTATGDYGGSTHSNAGALTTRSMALSAYYRLLSISGSASLFGGAGAGLSFVRVSDIYFVSRYRCVVAVCVPAAGTYDNFHFADFTDAVLSGHVYAGIDYGLSAHMALSLEVSFNAMGDVTDEVSYVYHAVPGLRTESTVSNIRHFTLMAKVRHSLGN